MRQAPTRRPRNYPDQRRTPRGRRFVTARSPREDLAVGAELLTEYGNLLEQNEQADKATKAFESAAAVRAALEPGGWRALQQKTGYEDKFVNLPVLMGVGLRQELEEAGRELRIPSLSSVAADGLRAVAEGRFVPPRVYTGSGEKRNLNVKVPGDVKEQVAKMLPALSQEAGYRVSLASIVTWWLADELGVNLPAPTAPVRLVIGSRLVKHFQARAGELGVELSQVLEDGIRDLVSGAWVFPAAPRAAKGSRPEDTPTRLNITIDDELRMDLLEIAPRLAQELGRQVYPGTVALAILRDRLGEPK